jgi:hypothetical protein
MKVVSTPLLMVGKKLVLRLEGEQGSDQRQDQPGGTQLAHWS